MHYLIFYVIIVIMVSQKVNNVEHRLLNLVTEMQKKMTNKCWALNLTPHLVTNHY